MATELSPFDKRLLNILQTHLPITQRPYARIARTLKSTEKTVLNKTRVLVKKGFIRRIGPVINWRAIGMATTLVTASVPEKKLKKVITAVNKLQGVSHNYLREHHYNLWFTLRADSQNEIKTILSKLSKRFALKFHSLTVKRTFKLDVRFDALSNGKKLLPTHDMQDTKRRTLSAIDWRILNRLQKGLKVTSRPFDFFDDDFENYDCLLHITEMLADGVIYRISAVANHHKLGFTANAMFVCQVCEANVIDLGLKLAKLNIVSHCYQRKLFPGWIYSLYAMMHGRSQTDIQRTAENFAKSHALKKWLLLPTKARLLNRKHLNDF